MLNAAIFYSICNNHRFYREPFDEACWALGVSNVSTSNFKEIFFYRRRNLRLAGSRQMADNEVSMTVEALNVTLEHS